MRTTITEGTGHARALREDRVSSPARSGSNGMVEERRIETRRWKESLREVPLSNWTSFIEGLQAVQKGVLTTTYSILECEPIHNFLSSISNLSKQSFRDRGSETVRSNPGKPVHGRRPLSKMWKSILRSVGSILTAMECDSLLFGLRIIFVHRESSLHENGFYFLSEAVREMLEGKN